MTDQDKRATDKRYEPQYRRISRIEEAIVTIVVILIAGMITWAGVQLNKTSAGMARMDQRVHGIENHMGRLINVMESQVEQAQLIKAAHDRLNRHERLLEKHDDRINRMERGGG
ncbi:hypothetical protein [Zhongshania sp.]|uniref:hypothetical protein n=1 Tax=Zhongshania sp. TaxID=1971902 RepID=UPI00356A42EF